MSSPTSPLPTPADVEAAHERVRPVVHRTPVLTSSYFDRLCGAELFFKCENFQKIGAFKIRGASNAIFSLETAELASGVVAHSSGNHAQAVALAARQRDIEATIVMPENSSVVKLAAVRDYGARVVLCASGGAAREAALQEEQQRSGATLIHPFNDSRIIAGQGTAARELLQDVENLSTIIAPVGGGGLLSGTILAAQAASSEPRVFGAEPALADDAKRSLEAGKIMPAGDPDTIADGLRTSLGELTFAVISAGAAGIITATEDQIVSTMRQVWMRMKILIEPSAAVPLAALLAGGLDLSGQRVGIIISGGNVDLDALPWID